jgi:hypothetical protein
MTLRLQLVAFDALVTCGMPSALRACDEGLTRPNSGLLCLGMLELFVFRQWALLFIIANRPEGGEIDHWKSN